MRVDMDETERLLAERDRSLADAVAVANTEKQRREAVEAVLRDVAALHRRQTRPYLAGCACGLAICPTLLVLEAESGSGSGAGWSVTVLPEVTRVEVVGDTGRAWGRSGGLRDVQAHVQDEGRTLKVFVRGDA